MRRMIALVALSALVLAACSDSGNEAAERLSQVSSRVEEAGSSRFAMTLEITAAALGGAKLTTSAEGVFDYANEQGRLVFDFGQLGGSGLGELTGGASIPETLEMVLHGSQMYMHLTDPKAIERAQDKEWVAVDAKEAAGSLASTGLGGGSDPRSLLPLIAGASKGTSEVGFETLRGTRTTHYSLTLDAETALENMPEEQQGQVRAMLKANDDKAVPVDVWLDDEGLPRQIRASFGVEGAESSVTLEMWEYGIAVDVEPPPAADTLVLEDPSKLAGLFGFGF